MIVGLVNQAVAVKQWSAARHTNEAKGSIGHFQVAFCVCIKTSLCAKPFIWKYVRLTSSFILLNFDMKGYA